MARLQILIGLLSCLHLAGRNFTFSILKCLGDPAAGVTGTQPFSKKWKSKNNISFRFVVENNHAQRKLMFCNCNSAFSLHLVYELI